MRLHQLTWIYVGALVVIVISADRGWFSPLFKFIDSVPFGDKAGHFLLTDETTNVTVELVGPGLDRETGNRVEVSGSLDAAATPVTDASQFIRVTAVRRIGRNCVVNRTGTAAAGVGGKAGKTAKAGGAAAGGSVAAISTTTIAIIGGVAVAATVGGLAAGGALPGQGGGSSPSISR